MISNFETVVTECIPLPVKEAITKSNKFGLSHTINIPLPVITYIIGSGQVSLLRTFLYLKYYCTVAGDGRYEVTTTELSDSLSYTRQTANSHLKKLIRMGWITEGFVRGWKKISKLCGGKDRTRIQTAKLNPCLLTSVTTLKAGCVYARLIYSYKVQSYKDRIKGKTAKTGAIKQRPLSARKVGEWFGLSIMSGSYFRTLLLQYGFIKMNQVFTLTRYTDSEVKYIKSIKEGVNLIWHHDRDCYAYQECNELQLVESYLVGVRSKPLR